MLNKITILCLPPNTSHATQPLDVGVFRALKTLWRSVLTVHYANPFNSVDKTNFPSLVAEFWPQLKGSNCTAGFEATGLHPYNPKALDHKILPPPVDMGPGAGDDMGGINEAERCMINSICDIFTLSHPPHPDNAQPGPSGLQQQPQQPRKRARVQMKAGEVLTTEMAAARVLAEEMEKQKKLDDMAERKRAAAEKKQAKAAAVAANKKKQAARKHLSIQRKALPKGANRQQGAVLNRARTLDGYVGLRQNPLSEGASGSEAVSSPPVSDLDGGLPSLAPVRQGKVQPPRKSSQKDDGYYVEQATIDNSDVDEPTSPAFTMADFSINDFVMFNVNKQCFPGKIVKVDRKKRRFFVATMTKFDHRSSASWQMPSTPREHDIALNDIKEKIKKPVGKKFMDREVFIEQMSNYGW